MSSIITNPYFDGSKIFLGLSDFTGIPLDKINFMIVCIVSFALAGFLRSSLSTEKVTPATRHVFCTFFGIFFGYFCFGKHVLHLTGFSTLMYAVILTQDPKFFHIQVFILGMIYLFCIHVYLKFIISYGIFTLDISGALMIMTGKVSSLACSLHDGIARREKDLTPQQKKRLVKEKPTILEFYSYMFSFLTLMAGPFSFYDEYMDFIYNRPIQEAQKKMSDKELNSAITFVALKKAIYGYLPVILALPFMHSYNVNNLVDDEFLEKNSFLYQLWYMNVLVSVARFNYYYAWIFAEAICNNAGYGLHGFDENGELRMDLLTNINIWKIEMAQNMHEFSKYWNTVTIRWLRFVIYDRVPCFKKLITYLTSTVWHGYHSCYYISASHGILYVYAADSFRRHVRPYFVGSRILKFFYDLFSILITRIAMLFMGMLLLLAEVESPMNFYREMYFFHIFLTISSIICPPILLWIKKESRFSNAKDNDESEEDKNKAD